MSGCTSAPIYIPTMFSEGQLFSLGTYHSCEKHILTSTCPSVHLSIHVSECVSMDPTGQILKFDIGDFYGNLSNWKFGKIVMLFT